MSIDHLVLGGVADNSSSTDEDDDVVCVRTSEVEIYARLRRTRGQTMYLQTDGDLYTIHDGVLERWEPFVDGDGLTGLGDVDEVEFVGE